MTLKDILAVLGRDGPQTGAQLLEKTGLEALPLWRECRTCPEVRLEIVGHRFLRLDRQVEGYARLSPSIRREFLTYTLAGLHGQEPLLAERTTALRAETERISRSKLQLARTTMQSVVAELEARDTVLEHACFVIAGDITYGMSHAVPRPETSTGKMVKGSDLDIIVVTSDDLPAAVVKALDDAIYTRKYYLLVHPDCREEIDYVIKPMSRVRQQLRFDVFESMVACKILHESQFLHGNAEIFRTVKDLVAEHGIPARLERMQQQAAVERKEAEIHLLEPGANEQSAPYAGLFFTREEGDEIY